MGFLASLLPGVRELRTPFVAGVAWLVALALLLNPSPSYLERSTHEFLAMADLLGDYSQVLVVGVCGMLAYLVGGVATGLSSGLFMIAGSRLDISFARLESSKFVSRRRSMHKLVRNFRRRITPVSDSAHMLTVDAMVTTLTQAGVPGEVAMMMPVRKVREELENCSLQLWKSAPEQYSEYDRLVSEAEFRRALLPPLLLISFSLMGGAGVWLPIAAVIGSFVLTLQSARSLQRAYELVANGAFLGYVTVPFLAAIVAEIDKAASKPEGLAAWRSALVKYLHARGYFEESWAFVDELATLDSSEDVKELSDLLEGWEPHYATHLMRSHEEYVEQREIRRAARESRLASTGSATKVQDDE